MVKAPIMSYIKSMVIADVKSMVIAAGLFCHAHHVQTERRTSCHNARNCHDLDTTKTETPSVMKLLQTWSIKAATSVHDVYIMC